MAKVDFRYERYGYTVLNVTDIERSNAFATEVFAMDPAGTGPNGERFYRGSANHHDIMLCPAKTAAYVRSGWELETEADVDKAFAHYTNLGLKPAWVSKEECGILGLERAFRIREPLHGICFEYYARMIHIVSPLQNRTTSFLEFGTHSPKWPCP